MTLEMLKQDCREEGRKEEREEMVRGLLNEGVPVLVIAKAAKITVEEVEAIKQNNL